MGINDGIIFKIFKIITIISKNPTVVITIFINYITYILRTIFCVNWRKKMTTRHTFRCSEELWNCFLKHCAENNTNCTERIRKLMREDINKKITLDDDKKDIIKLVDTTYKRSGRVPLDLISRNTTGQIEYEEVINYCKNMDYKLISSPETYTVCKDPTGW